MARHAKRTRKRAPTYEEGETLRESRKVDLAEIREAQLPRRRHRPAAPETPSMPAAPRTLPPDPLESERASPAAGDPAEARRAWIIAAVATSFLWLLLSRRRA